MGTILIILVTTAVAAVPVANLVVVQVIAFTILHERLDPATFRFFLGLFAFKLWVEAVTESAMLCGLRLFVGWDIATVATIPIACTIVIGIIAIAVAFKDEVGEATATALLLDYFLVEAGTCLAVPVLHFRFVATAIATVPIATTFIVAVVALAISLPGVHLAVPNASRFFLDIFGVLAFAINTVVIFVFWPAAVTAVPVASAVVIAIVAGLITFPSYNLAMPFAFSELWVQAFAFVAVAVLPLCVFLVAAAVTTVPTAAAMVVLVVAEIVTTPNVHRTLFGALNTFTINEQAFVIGVLALALATVHFEVHITRSAAVATVPVATTVVITFVANVVTLPPESLASSTAHSMWVKTGTLLAVFVVVVCPATIATVPITTAIVVTIVTCAIALPRTMGTFSR